MELAPSTPSSSRGGGRALRAGMGLTAHYPWLLLAAWAANLLTAIGLALLPALALAAGPGDRTVVRDMADGMDTWLWIEAAMSSLAEIELRAISPEADLAVGLGPVLLLTLLALLGVPLLGWLVGALIQGGILATYRDAPQPFGWRRFLRDGRQWWGSFLVLGAVQGLAAAVLLLPLVVGAAAVWAAISPALGWVLLALALAVNLVGLALFESTRVLAVATGRRNALRSLGAAARFVIRQRLPLAGLYLVTLAAAGLLHAVYRLGLWPILPLDAWPLLLVVTQTLLAARIALRLVRLAGISSLVGNDSATDRFEQD